MPSVGPDEVLVRVEACGMCGSDIHFWEGSAPIPSPPITLGHEPAGVIAVVGVEVEGWREGDRVAVRAGAGCGQCRSCLAGDEPGCPRFRVLGMHIDGGFAQYLKAAAASLICLPDAIPFEIGAILTDAVATPFHAITDRGGLKPGERVAVFGCGGLGLHAVQIARLLGAATVIAVDVRAAALARAERAGAHHAIDASGEAPHRRIREITEGQGVDVALEFVGSAKTIGQAVGSLARGGRAVIVGMGVEPIQLPPPNVFVWSEFQVIGSFGSTRANVESVLELVAAGKLDLSESVTARLPLAEVNEGLRMLHTKEGDPVRVVITP
ncbi:MAG: zinc-binding dehydrogenase [Chloroflexota bacterium]|nr:zinc-binding dehydrogenase [Chloroflexota bacterium]